MRKGLSTVQYVVRVCVCVCVCVCRVTGQQARVGWRVKVKVDNFRSGDHRAETDGDLPHLGSRFPQGQDGHH